MSIGTNVAHDNLVYHRGKIHSEYRAYCRAERRIKSGGFSIVNIRIGRDDSIRMSAPCMKCRNILTNLGCSHFIYTIDNNTWGSINGL